MEKVQWGRTGTAQRIFRTNYFFVSNFNFLHQILYQTNNGYRLQYICQNPQNAYHQNVGGWWHIHEGRWLWRRFCLVGMLMGGCRCRAGYLGNLPAQCYCKTWRLHMRRAMWGSGGRRDCSVTWLWPWRWHCTCSALHHPRETDTTYLLFLMTTENL